MQKKNKNLKLLKSTLEEGELSSNSDERIAHGSNEGPSYRYFIAKIY